MLDTLAPPDGYQMETVPCYTCGSEDHEEFIFGQDDLTGKPGTFRFVTCNSCGLTYQTPRIVLDQIPDYYDDNYIAHRKQSNWGMLTPFYNWAMSKHDREKIKICKRHQQLDSSSEVLDVGCAVGSFLSLLMQQTGCRGTGIDFKDLSPAMKESGIEFHCGLFYEADLSDRRFDLITMWHFLEHDYDPLQSLSTAHRVLKDDGLLVIEVPRLDSRTFSLFGERWPGLQAPQHTVVLDRDNLLRWMDQTGYEVVEYLPWGAFPAYFYLFAGSIFKILKGRGVNLGRWMLPYFLGQLLCSPILLFEKQLNLSMQTVICRKRP
ncbi:MAG: class I SAM-dependent methyltransferase [Planctomycetota bacterium]|jgi:2-polyprenyl-3-methyl-5-hydroxy-6-metoxy-1,4-benzoquinol methylase|nr:class I SAM-dependent methyltransferase [Planctomycetota bacterium]